MPATFRTRLSAILAVAVMLIAVIVPEAKLISVPGRSDQRSQANKLYREGNFAEALTVYQQLALDEANNDKELPDDLRRAVECLNRVNRTSEFDAFFADVIDTHRDNWRLLSQAAEMLNEVPDRGFLIAGKFERGSHRGGGKAANSRKRDRVHAMQLALQAIELIEKDDAASARARAGVYRRLKDAVGRHWQAAPWRFQILTDLSELPDYEDGHYNYGHGSAKGAPVDEEGKPVLYSLPVSWEAAKSDGERWRRALEQIAAADSNQRGRVDLEWGEFLWSQFGVQANAGNALPVARANDAEDAADDGLTRDVHKLTDAETIARLATGPRRLQLPDEFNHISIFKRVAGADEGQATKALEHLVAVRMTRHQYPQAATVLKQLLAKTTNRRKTKEYQERINQIEKNWVQFQHVTIQPARTEATFEVRYRNGSEIEFTARPVDVEQFLSDTMTYLQEGPKKLVYQRTRIENIGHRLIQSDPEKYLGAAVANWTEKLEAPANHFDAVKTITTPLKKAGAFWVTGKINDGNEARMIIWVADTAITRKRVESGTLHFVADAETGKPVAKADVEFFGWRQERIEKTRDYRVLTNRFAERTDENGFCIPDAKQLQRNYQWLTVVRTNDGRFAYDGFNSVWNPQKIQPLQYSSVKVYTVTDRPVYRPQHNVKFRMWVRRPRFSEDNALYANKAYTVQIRNPKGDVVHEQKVTTDRWAGVDGEWSIPDDATLGRYSLQIGTPTKNKDRLRTLGQGSFRVEEYRKPEFEVTIDAPQKPVMLGEKIQATIRANYYFGAPVTEASVHYKVERSKKDSRWYPFARWDWLYAPGYWWFGYDYSWYPGWSRWGCLAPIQTWWGWNPDPPEVVAEGDAEIGADGTFKVDIDTAAALRSHSDSDHQYNITAEVVDQSRRTIIGTGSVLVARDPFKVFVWPNRGHYQSGDTVDVGIQARTPDGKPVAGKGKAKLLAVTYEDGKPVEQELESWDITTDDKGTGSVQMVIPSAGQFRISVTVEDEQAHTAEGAYIIFVRGPNEDGRGYRFNDLELITEKREYQPGETARLQINTNRLNSTVLLFVRPMNGLCPKPRVIELDGKSTTVDLQIQRDDMPNIFVEALTISAGRVHSQLKEIVIPPEQKIAHVEILPSAERYRPGAEAKVKLKLTDIEGRPFTGNTILSVYDASLEYIAASSIPEIRSFFWKVRRRHNISNDSTLQRTSGPLYRPRELAMDRFFGEDILEGVPTNWYGRGFGGGGGFIGGGSGGIFGGVPMTRSRGRGVSEGFFAADGIALPSEGAAALVPAGLGIVGQKAEVSDSNSVEPTVRSSFADTAHWVASATSDADGIVEVAFKVPDNLTTWKIKAWTLGDGTRVGSGSSDIISSKDLIIRPQTPRFFTESDQITLSAVVHNYLDSNKSTKVVLETEGGQLQILGDAERVVQVPADGEVRVDWDVEVVASGTAKVRMKALTDEESDAAELTVPAQVHGLLKTESFTGVIRPDDETATVEINVPAARIEEQSRLEVRFSPTLAGAMVDALPYLIEYPYGCTEQTLNRFLPAVITQKTLQRMGVNLADVQQKRTNLNAQELGDAAERAAQWKRYDRNPVFDEEELNRIVRSGVQDLSNMQLSDGGWGWFSGFGEHSTAHLTSVVTHGLTVVRASDVPVLPDVIERGVAWLKNYQAEELDKLREGDRRRENADVKTHRRRPHKMAADNTDALVAWVLAEHDAHDPAMTDYLYRDRTKLSVYSKALTGLVLHQQQDAERRSMLLRNIEQTLVQDDENQTAWLEMPQNSWWYWYGSENEAMARYLQLLLKASPDSETAPRLVKYLLNNRKHGTYWNSTRDTAIVVEAMADYLQVTNEDQPDMTVEILVDGTLQKKVRITADNLFSFDNVMLLSGDAVKTGAHRVELRRTGSGPVYFNAYLTNFTKEDPITATGLEVKVQRRFFRLERDDDETAAQGDRGQVVSQQTVKYRRIPLENLGGVTSGELIEVELVLESKNDYEYLLLEDRKPSGFEPDDQRSGYIFEGLRAYRELRDDRVSFFLSKLARGRHSVSYRLRAETPSRKVSALPAKIEGMYAPELVGNSKEFKLRVGDRLPSGER